MLIPWVRTVRVEKQINEVVNRLNRTKVERKPDLKGESMISVFKFYFLPYEKYLCLDNDSTILI